MSAFFLLLLFRESSSLAVAVAVAVALGVGDGEDGGFNPSYLHAYLYISIILSESDRSG